MRASILPLYFGLIFTTAWAGGGDGGGTGSLSVPGTTYRQAIDMIGRPTATLKPGQPLNLKKTRFYDVTGLEEASIQDHKGYQEAETKLRNLREQNQKDTEASQVLDDLIILMSGLKFWQTEYRLKADERRYHLPEKDQRPVHTVILYKENYGPIISLPEFNQLDSDSQTSSFIHEAFRRLQSHYPQLTDKDIQIFTRAIMDNDIQALKAITKKVPEYKKPADLWSPRKIERSAVTLQAMQLKDSSSVQKFQDYLQGFRSKLKPIEIENFKRVEELLKQNRRGMYQRHHFILDDSDKILCESPKTGGIFEDLTCYCDHPERKIFIHPKDENCHDRLKKIQGTKRIRSEKSSGDTIAPVIRTLNQ